MDYLLLEEFPNVLGWIDGTFVKIIGPHEKEADIVNRKGVQSLNIKVRLTFTESNHLNNMADIIII